MTGAAFDGTYTLAFGNVYGSTTQYSVHKYSSSGSSSGNYMNAVDFPGLAPAVYDIAWTADGVWVARDESDSPIRRYNTAGAVTGYILGTEVPFAAGLTVDGDGYLWVSDPANDKIYKVDTTTSIEDASHGIPAERDLRVSANPFMISTTLNCAGFNSSAVVTVFDIRGRMVQQSVAGGSDFLLDGSDLSPGTYLIRVTDSGGSSTLRVCKTAY